MYMLASAHAVSAFVLYTLLLALSISNLNECITFTHPYLAEYYQNSLHIFCVSSYILLCLVVFAVWMKL